MHDTSSNDIPDDNMFHIHVPPPPKVRFAFRILSLSFTVQLNVCMYVCLGFTVNLIVNFFVHVYICVCVCVCTGELVRQLCQVMYSDLSP